MQYDWIDFYTEFATKLLPFKTDRKTLIQKIYAVYDAAGISVPKLESGDVIIDVDPFTIFGTFNKGITNANRIAILNGIASEFGIATHVPSIFDGIPVLNNLKATFYGFKDDRKAGDIDNLWSLFETALVLADNDTADNRRKFSDVYDMVHDQLCMHISGKFKETDFESAKVDIENAEEDIESQKADIRNKLLAFSDMISEKTINHTFELLSKCGKEEYFGRTIVEDITGLKSTRASELIKLLVDSKVIVSVTGHGKGKYRFQL